MTERSNYESLRDLADEVAADLVGTCQGLYDALGEDREHLQDDIEFCRLLDDRVMECSTCGWWVEANDGDFPLDGNEFVCTECLGDG